MAATGGEALTGKGVGEDFRDSCSLCMEPYQGRNPKILPCFHTFCLPCLTALAESTTAETPDNQTQKHPEKEEQADETNDPGAGQGEPEVSKTEDREKGENGESGEGESDANRWAGSVFLCPTCRSPVSVPEGGVAALQTNFYIVTEAEVTSQPPQCDMCDEGEAKEATHTCDKCRQRMCRACRRLHDKLLNPRAHPVRALNIHQRATSKLAETRKWCTVHRDQELCFHCKDCDVSICLHCKLTSHQPHVTEDMAAATLRAKEELMTLVAKAKEQITAVEKSLIQLSQDSKELLRQRQEVTDELGARYEEILRWVNRSRDELLETIAATADTTLAGLKAEEKSARVTVETLSDLVSRASRRTSSNPEVLLLKTELQGVLLGEDSFDHYSVLGNRVDLKTFLQVNADSTVLDLEVVRSFMGELSREERNPTFSSLWKQFHDMKDNIVAQNTKLNFLEAQLRQMISDNTATPEVEVELDRELSFEVPLSIDDM